MAIGNTGDIGNTGVSFGLGYVYPSEYTHIPFCFPVCVCGANILAPQTEKGKQRGKDDQIEEEHGEDYDQIFMDNTGNWGNTGNIGTTGNNRISFGRGHSFGRGVEKNRNRNFEQEPNLLIPAQDYRKYRLQLSRRKQEEYSFTFTFTFHFLNECTGRIWTSWKEQREIS